VLLLLPLSNSFFFSCCCRLIYCADEKINFVSTLVFSRALSAAANVYHWVAIKASDDDNLFVSLSLSLQKIIHSFHYCAWRITCRKIVFDLFPPREKSPS
jgi:hypothetical protein